jgi:molybdenum cofactor cytidylyltransferase
LEKNHSIWAVVLAAGESKRMETSKLILPYRNKTIISTLIGNIRSSHVDDIIMVLGAWKKELMEEIKSLQVRTCINERYQRGMLSSVICGLKALPEEAGAALIFPGDLPDIAAEITDSVIQAHRRTGKGIVIPVYNGRRGHPILIARKYFTEVEKLDSDTGLRGLSKKFKDDIHEQVTVNGSILSDIDTREDYLNAINKTL